MGYYPGYQYLFFGQFYGFKDVIFMFMAAVRRLKGKSYCIYIYQCLENFAQRYIVYSRSLVDTVSGVEPYFLWSNSLTLLGVSVD